MLNLKSRFLVFIFSLVYFFTASVAPVLAAINYQYDAAGNQTSDGQNCFTYNEANQLSKVKSCASQAPIAEYIYDAEGTRIVKKEYQNGVLSNTVYIPTKSYQTKKVAQTGATENTAYYQANGEIVARKNPDGTKTYYQNDHLGSTSLLTNQTGGVVEQTTYYPFGGIRSGGTLSKFLYTGKEKDAETGLNYYGARYYDSHLQRFTQPDTILPNIYDPQQLNRYSYVNNNPLKYTDPSGHCIWDLCMFEAAIAVPLLAPVILKITENPAIVESAFAAGIGAFQTGEALGDKDFQRAGENGLFTVLATVFTHGLIKSTNVPGSKVDLGEVEANIKIKSGESGGPNAGKRYIPADTIKKLKVENPNSTCVFCHTEVQAPHIDHSVPASKGGTNSIYNMQFACPHCNLSKGDGLFPKTPPANYKLPWPPSWWNLPSSK